MPTTDTGGAVEQKGQKGVIRVIRAFSITPITPIIPIIIPRSPTHSTLLGAKKLPEN